VLAHHCVCWQIGIFLKPSSITDDAASATTSATHLRCKLRPVPQVSHGSTQVSRTKVTEEKRTPGPWHRFTSFLVSCRCHQQKMNETLRRIGTLHQRVQHCICLATAGVHPWQREFVLRSDTHAGLLHHEVLCYVTKCSPLMLHVCALGHDFGVPLRRASVFFVNPPCFAQAFTLCRHCLSLPPLPLPPPTPPPPCQLKYLCYHNNNKIQTR
jgi:hypothetical protein